MFFQKVLLLFISAFFILSQPLSAQESVIVKVPSKFQQEWDQLDSMRLYGMSVDGIALLNGIIEKSVKEKNGPELFRALSEYPDFTMNSMREDDDRYEMLEKIERLADKVEAPLSNIVHGFLAEQFGQKSYYWFYWGQDYSVKCIIDGKVELFSSTDPDGRKRIMKYHQQKSIENSSVIQKINMVDYANSLSQQAVYYQQFPTLYDFMVNQVIQELLTDQYTAEYQNIQVDSSWFDPASELTVRNEKNEIIGLFQQVELFHWKAQKMDAFTNWTLARLQYVRSLYEAGGVKNTSQKYLQTLADLKARLQNNPSVLGVIVDTANEILNQNPYDWKPDLNHKDNREKRAEVHALLENGIKEFPGSIYLKSAKAIQDMIEQKQIRFDFKGQNSLGEAAMLTISYQNVPGAYLNVYHIDGQTTVKNGKNLLKGMKTTKVHEQLLTLGVNGKYNLHSKDFLIPAWSKTGDYLVLITSTKDSADIVLNMDSLTGNTNVAFAKITVHGIRVITKLNNTKLEIVVLDTKTGKQVSGAEVFSTVKEKTRTLLGKTNKEGKLVIELTETIRWTVDYKKDSITEYAYYYPSYSESGNKQSYKIITDRGIYRPGQVVHFKVFAVEGKSPDFKSLANHKAEIVLAGSDGTDLGKLSGTTNEFGTFAGTFQLPVSGFMPGNLYLNVNGLSAGNILVEEYKRPTFEIESKFNKTSYKPGEKVTISGKVKAYSGYGLGDSKVHVKVFSSAGYRYYYVTPESILDTVIASNSNGEFSLAFTANSRDSKFGSLFSYEIAATSISGETQRAENSVFIGKSHSEWDVKFPATVLSSEKAFGYVKLKDKEESKESKTVQVEILKRKPGKTGVSFVASEFKAFDDAKFKKAFPAGSYGVNAESLYTSFGAMTIQSGDSIDIQKMVKGEAGTYQVKMIYKTALETIDHTVTFDYINTDSKKGQHQSDLWVESLNKTAKPGDEVSFLIGSSYPKVNVLVEIYRGEKMLRQEWKQIKGRAVVKYTIQKEDLGGIKMHILTEKESDLLIASAEVKVPFESKILDVKLETKRDILRPGAEEKWILSVSSKDGSPVSAEMIAAMTDASLDMFTSNAWNLDLYHDNYSYSRWENENRTYVYFSTLGAWNPVSWSFGAGRGPLYEEDARGARSTFMWKSESTIVDGVVAQNANVTRKGADKNAEHDENESAGPPAEKAEEKPEKIRTNFNETAFFYPQVVAGSDNKFNLEFTLPDALTRWKFQALVHDKMLRSGYSVNEFIAQKELMVEPNEPRFFRAGDQFVFTANVVNLTDNPQEVIASLEWFNPFTNEVLPTIFGVMANQKVSVQAKGSQTVSWTLNVPKTGLELVAYRIKVASAQFADGEEKAIPVLSNRTQVIESVPVTVEGKGDFVFELSKLLNAGSTTQRNEKLVLEYNSNPLWTVVMAIPYLSADTYESAENVFSKYFANKVAQKILEQNPAIEAVLTQLNASDPDKFLSALEANPELKAIILAETPWVLDAKSESEQRKRIAQLFDKNNMKQQEKFLENKLIQMRNANGGWSWFAGGESNLYITQHILSGFGHLKALGIQSEVDLSSGLQLLEDKYEERYSKLTKEELLRPESITSMDIQWLYLQALLGRKTSRAGDYYAKSLSKEWTKFPLQVQAMAGTYFHHANMPEMAAKIMKSVQNRSTVRKNLGTYWNENKNSYYWDRNPIETQVGLIEFYQLMHADPAVISSMKLWLLNQKRGQYWQSTKTTALACYAMLMNTEKVSLQSVSGTVKVGSQQINTNTSTASLGYVKQTWNGSEIQPSMGKVSISQTENVPAFGALTLVYTDEMEKISKNTAGLVIEKQMYVVRGGKEILITPATELVLGDLVRVRLQIATDRDLEFVHMKDLRASGMEPVETISAHKMTGNLYFYMVSKDASTEFFIDNLSKGKHNLTYDLRISGKGKQSTGYAIAECLYAPEFRANSASGTVEVK